MRALDRRLKAIERREAKPLEVRVLFQSLVGAHEGRPDGEAKIFSAIVPGSSLGQIMRGEDEAEGAFCQRVFAKVAVKRRPENMTDSELKICIAAGSAESALELASTGELSDANLKQALT